MEIIKIPVADEGLASNCYLIKNNGYGAVVDPSADFRDIMDTAALENVEIKYIILTHGHFDHMLNLELLRKTTGALVCIHKDDAEYLSNSRLNLFLFFEKTNKTFDKADIELKDGDTIELGGDMIKVIHTPGHTPGSACFLCDKFIVTGDTLFNMSAGRCDLPGGDESKLVESLKKLKKLDPSLIIYPGHDSSSTMALQINNNPYMKGI